MKSLTLPIVLCGVAVVVALGGCDLPTACEARPTTMARQPDGTMACFEADGELCDDDPCDAEADEFKAPQRPTATTKPKATTTRR